MISQFPEITSMPYADRLNVIHRLRLLRNTTGELSAHTGIQLRNNSFSKKLHLLLAVFIVNLVVRLKSV